MTLSSLISTDIAFKHSIRVNAMSDLEQYLATLEEIRHKHQESVQEFWSYQKLSSHQKNELSRYWEGK